MSHLDMQTCEVDSAPKKDLHKLQKGSYSVKLHLENYLQDLI